MAKVDLVRRAEIGRDRRARTRALLMQTARRLYAERPLEAVTIDELATAAGLAKGTFYVHFTDLSQLHAELAEELTQEFDDLVQPMRASSTDPIERIAAGCAIFLREAVGYPAWAGLVAHSFWALPSIGQSARAHLAEDLRDAARQGRLGPMNPELSFEIVMGVVLQLVRCAGERRLSPAEAKLAIGSILRAIGVEAGEARILVERVSDRLVAAEPSPPPL